MTLACLASPTFAFARHQAKRKCRSVFALRTLLRATGHSTRVLETRKVDAWRTVIIY